MPVTTWTATSMLIVIGLITRCGCIFRVMEDENDTMIWNLDITFGAKGDNEWTSDHLPIQYQPFIDACRYIGHNSLDRKNHIFNTSILQNDDNSNDDDDEVDVYETDRTM